MTNEEFIKLQPIRHQLHSQAMEAMNSGNYVTIIWYVRVPRGTDYIGGQTYKECHLQSAHHH